jgi:hypothetical protein
LCGLVSLHNFQITAEADRVTDAGLADLWRLVNLHSLGIAAPQITGSGLATFHELPSVEWLTLQGAGITDVACEHVAKSDSLRQLSIGTWQAGGPPALGDDGLRQLAQARNLMQLDLMRKRTQVTDAGVAELRRLQPRLTVNAHGP